MPNMTTIAYPVAVPPDPYRLLDGERWYAVHSLPSCELRAQMNLHNQGYRTFLPKRRKTIRHARKLRTVEAPFFPGYLFVILDVDRQPWRRINSTFGVARLIMQGEQPHPVPRGVVEALRASADDREILQLTEHLRIGSPVRLLAGPFADQLAILDGLDDGARVRVLLDVMGRRVAITTESRNLLPLA